MFIKFKDGNWGEWGAYSTCSLTCGGGTQTRYRTCSNPPPLNGGLTCPGSNTENATCNTQTCTGGGGEGLFINVFDWL